MKLKPLYIRIARLLGVMALLVYIGFGVKPIIYNDGLDYVYMVPVSPGSACYTSPGVTYPASLSAGADCRTPSDYTAFWWPGWSNPNSATSHYIPVDLGLAALGIVALVYPYRRRHTGSGERPVV